MRIACCLSGIKKVGGAERRLSRIFKSIHSEKYDITLVLIRYDQEKEIDFTYRKYLGNDINIIYIEKNYADIFKHMKDSQYDVACYIGPYRDMMPFLFGAKSGGSKCLWLLVNTFLSNYIFDNIGQKALFKICLQLSDHIDCLYPSSLPVLRKHTNKEITITPCAFTDLSLFAPKKKEKKIVFLSRLTKGKNCDLFLKSIALVRKEITDNDYSVIVAGDGEEYDSLLALSKTLGIYDVVEFVGYTNPESILPSSNIFLSLQDNNNYPSQSLIEALSCGCYVIATDVGDTAKLVHSEFGALCQFDEKCLSESISNYIKLTEECKNNVVVEARRFALKTFDVNVSVKHYKQLFDDLYKVKQ